MAFCAEKEITSILNERNDIKQPLSFSNSKAIKNIQQMKYISNAMFPFATYVIDYQVFQFEDADSHQAPSIVRQTVLIKKTEDRNSRWTFEVLNYEETQEYGARSRPLKQ